MTANLFHNGVIVLPDGFLPGGAVETVGDRIVAVSATPPPLTDAECVDLEGGYLAPGFVDLHVHGGAGADFMDGTDSAFRTVCQAHARHGTTSLLATSTVARHEQIIDFLQHCRHFQKDD